MSSVSSRILVWFNAELPPCPDDVEPVLCAGQPVWISPPEVRNRLFPPEACNLLRAGVLCEAAAALSYVTWSTFYKCFIYKGDTVRARVIQYEELEELILERSLIGKPYEVVYVP